MTSEKTSSKDLEARHARVMFPCTATYYAEAVALAEGKGARVVDHDGKSYLDFFGGILTVSVGHANERVNGAVKAQVDRLVHVSTLYPTLPIVELAEKLVRVAPGKLDRVFFTASGTEADETAVALAQAHTGNLEIIALRHAYSGRSMLAQALTAHAKYRMVPTQVAAVKHAVAPYCYRCPKRATPQSCALECADDVEDVIRTTTTGRIAGFIGEPILGVGGFITPPKDYWKRVHGIVKKYGGVFIADEVQTGFGRTGNMMWGISQYGVEPDVVTMAKGIANGFPLSATLTTTAIAEATRGVGSISTFGGNPVSCAAAIAVLEEIEQKRLLENASERGGELRGGLLDLKKSFPRVVGDVRGMGLMQALELVVDEQGGDRTPNPSAVGRLFEETKKRGLLIGRGGLEGNVVRLSPSLDIGAGDVKEALRILEDSFASFASI